MTLDAMNSNAPEDRGHCCFKLSGADRNCVIPARIELATHSPVCPSDVGQAGRPA
jgi:hypothetical protein